MSARHHRVRRSLHELAAELVATVQLLGDLGGALVERDVAEECRTRASELAKAWNRAVPYLPRAKTEQSRR